MNQDAMLSATPPVTDDFVELGCLRFHFRDWRSQLGDAPILVLLHGFTGHARSWDPFAEAMSGRYRVLALDLRGHGESAWAASYSLDNMVCDLEGFVKALGLKRFCLAGLSLGGLVTMTYASRRPRELDAAVVIDFGPEIAEAGLARIRGNVQATDIFDTRKEAFAIARRDNDRPPEPLHRLRSDAGLMRIEDGRWTYRYDRALRIPGALKLPESSLIWSACALIEVPTLIVRGEQSDILSAEIANRMAQTIPNSHLATIADAGHGVPYDAPESFLQTVCEFFDNHRGAEAPVGVNGGSS